VGTIQSPGLIAGVLFVRSFRYPDPAMTPELLAELKKKGFPLQQVVHPLGTLERAFDEMWGIEHYKEPTFSELLDELPNGIEWWRLHGEHVDEGEALKTAAAMTWLARTWRGK